MCVCERGAWKLLILHWLDTPSQFHWRFSAFCGGEGVSVFVLAIGKANAERRIPGSVSRRYCTIADIDPLRSAAQIRARRYVSSEMATVMFRMTLLFETADGCFPRLVLYLQVCDNSGLLSATTCGGAEIWDLVREPGTRAPLPGTRERGTEMPAG